MPRAWLRHRQ